MKAEIPSDVLPTLREIVEHPAFSALGGILRVRVVVDANSILSDMYWLHRKRRNPAARSNLREVIEAGVAVAYAPPDLEREVLAGLARFSVQYGIPCESLESSWAEYRKLIKWIPARTIYDQDSLAARDPSDAPYVALALQIGAAAVYTHDRDYESFEALLIDAQVILTLKTYARLTATSLAIKLAGVSAFAVSHELVGAARRICVSAWASFRKLPPAIQIAVAGVLIGFVVYKPSREWILAQIKPFGVAAAKLVQSVIVESLSALGEAENGLRALDVNAVANRKPKALADYAAVACAEAKDSLTVPEVLNKILVMGYKTKSADLQTYLRRVLRNDHRFHELNDGRWLLAPVEGLFSSFGRHLTRLTS